MPLADGTLVATPEVPSEELIPSLLTLSDDLPMAIVIVDTAERIEEFLPQLDELISEGLVILDDVEVVKYVGRPAG